MYEQSKEVLLLWDFDNADLHMDAFLSILYLLLFFQRKKRKVSQTTDQLWMETNISLESSAFPRAVSHKANELMSHYAQQRAHL